MGATAQRRRPGMRADDVEQHEEEHASSSSKEPTANGAVAAAAAAAAAAEAARLADQQLSKKACSLFAFPVRTPEHAPPTSSETAAPLDHG